mmetsp:Transcript_78451/g.109043  ORF Transcript_78451/g.109043 Transcript_78451/m.109043 type:complete len:138 (-) Transcript_78451:106-519(-)
MSFVARASGALRGSAVQRALSGIRAGAGMAPSSCRDAYMPIPASYSFQRRFAGCFQDDEADEEKKPDYAELSDGQLVDMCLSKKLLPHKLESVLPDDLERAVRVRRMLLGAPASPLASISLRSSLVPRYALPLASLP